MSSYSSLLSPWPQAMKNHLYRFPNQPDCACYGPGSHGHWALQSNNTAAAAFAVLATDPGFDASKTGMSRDEMLDWTLGMIRFAFSTHHTGSNTATDQKTWGHSWISALCMERLAHGIEALGDLLPEEDRAALTRVIVSEADWLLDNYPVLAGLVENNKPESNIWNGCMLYRAAYMAPESPRCQEYMEKGTQFLLNGISIPEDAESATMIAGKPLRDWHVGANMSSEMGCDHHGYQNVGYMVICLSNIAMMHFSCKANGWKAPEGLYHHAEELWKLVKSCTFPDGRLLRIGGDTRARYCYCQDYAIPSWLWARDYLGDRDVPLFEEGWLKQVKKEVQTNGDGRFLSTRLAGLEAVSPLYFVRLEGDRGCTLSMGSYWNRLYGKAWAAESPQPTPVKPSVPLTTWSEDFHGSCLARGKKRIASWTWRAAAPPQGLCVPADESSMAEWQFNLSGKILGMGRINEAKYTVGHADVFDGGFVTCGEMTIQSCVNVAEGDADADVAVVDLACAALPDDRTMVVLQRARAVGRPYLREVKGLLLQVGNDIFNNNVRHLSMAEGEYTLQSCPGKAETIVTVGNWLNIDDKLSVIRAYGEALSVHRPANRQVTIYPAHNQLQKLDAGGNLYAEELCCGCVTDVHAPEIGAQLLDFGVVILADASAADSANYAEIDGPEPIDCGHPDLRGVKLTDANGKVCAVVANFADETLNYGSEEIPAGHVVII